VSPAQAAQLAPKGAAKCSEEKGRITSAFQGVSETPTTLYADHVQRIVQGLRDAGFNDDQRMLIRSHSVAKRRSRSSSTYRRG
jgi:hypothetical protein